MVAAGMPEDQQARVVAALQAVGTRFPIPSAAGTSVATDVIVSKGANSTSDDGAMDLDEDVLDQMAEAAVAPAGAGESAVQERTAKVAEVKASLTARKSDIARRFDKVRKVARKT